MENIRKWSTQDMTFALRVEIDQILLVLEVAMDISVQAALAAMIPINIFVINYCIWEEYIYCLNIWLVLITSLAYF